MEEEGRRGLIIAARQIMSVKVEDIVWTAVMGTLKQIWESVFHAINMAEHYLLPSRWVNELMMCLLKTVIPENVYKPVSACANLHNVMHFSATLYNPLQFRVTASTVVLTEHMLQHKTRSFAI